MEPIINMCLRRRESARYPSAAALADALARWLQGGSRHSRRRYLAAAASVAGLALAPFLFLHCSPNGGPSPSTPDAGVVLIGPARPNPPLRWIVGAERGTAVPTGNANAIVVRTKDLALIELLPETPTGSYELRAEIQYLAGMGEGGIYIGHLAFAGRHRTEHLFCRLAFDERAAARVDFCIGHWNGALNRHWIGKSQDIETASEDGFRYLTMRVSAEGIVNRWMRQDLNKISATAIQYEQKAAVPLAPTPWATISRRGLGLYAHECDLMIRSVTVQTLPDA